MSVQAAISPATAPSSGRSSGLGALPIVGQTREPAAVRDGSPAAKNAYATAEGFEEMLLQQLSQSLIQSSGLGGEAGGAESEEATEGGGSAQAGGGELAALLPQTLTEGIMRAGGLGLTTQLMDSLDPSATTQPARPGATGGTSS